MNAARIRSVAIEKLMELRSIILEHMLKISVLPSHEACNHWQKEINSYQKRLRRYHKGKGSKPNYTQAMLWEYIWEDQIDELPMGFVEEYEIKHVQLDLRDIKTRVQNFIDGILKEK